MHFRAKTTDSFGKKVATKGYQQPLVETTDLAGIRIILESLEHLERVCDLIKQEFSVDEEKSVDKQAQLEPNKFGYLSKHFIISLNPHRGGLREWSRFANLKAEIQVRTMLQHAWADIEHSLGYKNEIGIPENLKRRLFRLSALLELADQEFLEVIRLAKKNVTEYAEDLAKGELDLGLNIDSLRTYTRTSDEAAYWQGIMANIPDNEIVAFEEVQVDTLEYDLRLAIDCGLRSIEEIDRVLKNAHSWGGNLLDRYVSFNRMYWGGEGRMPWHYNDFLTPIIKASHYYSLVAKRKIDPHGKFDWNPASY